MSSAAPDLPPFLTEGVRFACTDCGACCTGAPGRVRVTGAELEAIAAARGIPVEAAKKRLARRVDGEWLLQERANGDCVLFENGRCSVHAVKPTQCRLYPFWFQNMRSEAAWRRTCEACPGIGQGPRVPPEEILKQVREDLVSREPQ